MNMHAAHPGEPWPDGYWSDHFGCIPRLNWWDSQYNPTYDLQDLGLEVNLRSLVLEIALEFPVEKMTWRST